MTLIEHMVKHKFVSTRASARRMIRSGAVFVNGENVKEDMELPVECTVTYKWPKTKSC